MYPKSACDYMTEINRLFPRTTENDVYQTPNRVSTSHYSPFQQSTPVRSSSSTDSTSPDSFPDMSRQSDHERQAYDTPFIVKRQRPIVGRKIFDNTDRLPPMLEPPTYKPFEHGMISNNIWQPDEQLLFPRTPPNKVEQHNNFSPRFYYELFPVENKGFEFTTPVSAASPVSNYTNTSSNFSPTLSMNSPKSTFGLQHMPTSPFRLPSQPNSWPSSSRYQDVKPTKMCTFCRKNGETPLVYMTHTVKEKVGNQNIVTCPILRSHVCSTCGASGDNAHTITYCPILRSNNNGQPLQSTTITLKNTRIKSNGRRRY